MKKPFITFKNPSARENLNSSESSWSAWLFPNTHHFLSFGRYPAPSAYTRISSSCQTVEEVTFLQPIYPIDIEFL